MTTGTRTDLTSPDDEVVTAEALAVEARRAAGDDGTVAAQQAVGSHNSIDTSTAPTIDVIRAGIRSLLIAWDGVEAVHGHGYYEAQIDTDPAFGSPDDFYKGKATFTVFDGLTTGVTYYARVRPVDAAGNVGPWSSSTGAQTTDATDTGDIADDAVTTVKIEDLAVTNAKIQSLTVAKLTAGTISGEEIVIAGGTAGILRSDNFVAGSSGWRIRGNGSAEFNNVTVRGEIIATSGEISGALTVSGSIEVESAGHIRTGTGNTYIEMDGGSAATMSFVEAGVVNGQIFTDSPSGTIDLFIDARNGLGLSASSGSIGLTASVGVLCTAPSLAISGGRLRFGNLAANDYIDWDNGLGQLQFHLNGVQEFTLGAAGLIIPNVNNDFADATDDPVLVNSAGQLHIDTSSRRHKTDIRPLPDDLPPITMLQAQAYSKDEVEQFGLIAEDIAELWPQVATYNDDGTVRNYRDRGILALVVDKLADLERRMKRLENR